MQTHQITRTLKVTLVLLSCLSCCTCSPTLIRVIDSQDEVTLASKGLVPKPPGEDTYISVNGNLDGSNNIGELLRNRISSQMSYQDEQSLNQEDEPELIPVPLPNPIKFSLDHIRKPISEHKHAISKMTGVDPYEKLLESFIRGIMSRLLQAEIKEVRVEDMGGLNKRKRTVYN